MFDSIDFINALKWTSIVITGTVTWYIFYVRWKLTYWERQGIVGPKPQYPIIGAKSSETPKAMIESAMDNYQKYGKIYGIYSGLQASLVVSDPDLLRSICVKDFHSWPKGFATNFTDPTQRDSLINLFGEPWKRMRTILSPTFSSGKIKKMFNLIKVCNRDAQKVLTTLTTNGQADFDPKYFWSRYNLDVIAKCCFAVNLDVYGDKDDTILNKFIKSAEPKFYQQFARIVLPRWFISLMNIQLENLDNTYYLRDMIFAMIEQRKNGSNSANDFLQSLIDLSDENEKTPENEKRTRLNRDEIVASSILFLVAGYETTSNLLTWACYRLATNPNAQEKLFEELSKVDIEDYEVLHTLPYLDGVINETLRIDPPVTVFQRHNEVDYQISGTEAIVRKGTVCSIPTYAIHHDPENYPNPEVFDPERFIDNTPAPFTFLPFGAGPRTCIGMRFALTNAKLSLASLVRNYQIVTTDKTPKKQEIVPWGIILTPSSLSLGIRPRKTD